MCRGVGGRKVKRFRKELIKSNKVNLVEGRTPLEKDFVTPRCHFYRERTNIHMHEHTQGGRDI